jgi:hypothetical protein
MESHSKFHGSSHHQPDIHTKTTFISQPYIPMISHFLAWHVYLHRFHHVELMAFTGWWFQTL